MTDICKIIDKDRKYYIYGIAGLAKFGYKKITKEYGKEIISGFIQTEPEKETFCDKKVYSVQQAVESADASDMFILASGIWIDAMKNNLMEAGVDENSIITLKDYDFVIRYIPNTQVKNLLLWPPLEKNNPGLIEKIKWFIPDKILITIFSSNQEVISNFNNTENVQIISLENLNERLEITDYICVWDAEKIDSCIDAYREKIHIVDPEFYYLTEITNYRYLYYSGFSEVEKKEFQKHSLEVFNKMKKEYTGVRRGNVFCTGPSIEEITGKSYQGDFNVICNSMVKDKELLENIRPSLITFGDLAFYLSPNNYCKAFYKDLIESYEKYHFYIATYDYEVPLVKKHFPMLYDRLIGVKTKNELCFPSDLEICVRGTGNICTVFMLPIASAICDKIGIAGCTGRTANETYFWKHNGRTQYIDLMHYVFEAYPSFFKYQNYEDYYDQHCISMEELLKYGELMGKSYVNLTTSFIPALKKRTE